jgi:hypothetical protein
MESLKHTVGFRLARKDRLVARSLYNTMESFMTGAAEA